MFCTNCGKKISNDAEFCTICGKKVSSESSMAQEGTEKLKAKSRRLRNSSVVFVSFIVTLLAYGYYAFFYKQYTPNSSESTTASVIVVVGIFFITLVYLIVLLINIRAAIFSAKRTILYLIHHPIWGAASLAVLAGLMFWSIWAYSSHRPSSLLVTVAKGPVAEATVNIYELNANGGKGDLIAGPLSSDASGQAKFDLPAGLPKRLFIESKGGFYKSEATGKQVQMGDNDGFTAVLEAGTKIAAVTPFTHMAAALAQAKIQGGEVPDSAVISANEVIAKQYGLKSILDIAPIDATASNASQATAEQRQYGLLLAGFSQLAKNLDVRSVDLANALAKDWSDGILDGQESGRPIVVANGPLLGNAGINKLNDAVNQFAKTERNYTSLRESSIALNPVLEKINFRVITTTLPAWVSGQSGSYAVTAKGGSQPLIWSLKSGSLPGGFTLSKDGIISGVYTLSSGVTKKIFPPFTLGVKDQQGQTQNITLSVTIATEAPKITVTNPPALMVGQSYEEIIATVSGGIPPYEFSSSGPMPMGMKITASGNNAVLTGSPKARGNFSFRVCVIDSARTEKCGDISFQAQEDGNWDGIYEGVGAGSCYYPPYTIMNYSEVYGNRTEDAGKWNICYNVYKNKFTEIKDGLSTDRPWKNDIAIGSSGYLEENWQVNAPAGWIGTIFRNDKYQFTPAAGGIVSFKFDISEKVTFTEEERAKDPLINENKNCTYIFTGKRTKTGMRAHTDGCWSIGY